MSTAARSSFVRPELGSLKPYVLVPHDARDKMDQNENPFDFPAELKGEVLRRLSSRPWNRYPDYEASRLRDALASGAGLDPAQVVVGNGSNEILMATVLAVTRPGAEVILPVPSFTLYRHWIAVAGARAVEVPIDPRSGTLPVDHMLEEIAKRETPPVVLLGSPNNPTGGALGPGDLAKLAASGAMILLDRAYGDFEQQPPPRPAPSLAVFSTFSKAWGLAGLRIGWLGADAALCTEVKKVKLPYSVGLVNEEAALVALENRQYVDDTVRMVVAERERVFEALRATAGITPWPSRANFITAEVRNAPEVFQRLLAAGILVRNLSGGKGLEQVLRISIGTPQMNDRVLQALNEAMK